MYKTQPPSVKIFFNLYTFSQILGSHTPTTKNFWYQQQQVRPGGLHPQIQPPPIQQAQPSPSPQPHMSPTPAHFQYRQQHCTLSAPPPGLLGWSERPTAHSTPAHSYAPVPAHVYNMGGGQQSGAQKRRADSLTAGEMPTPKRQAVAAPTTGAMTTQGLPATQQRPVHISPYQRLQATPPSQQRPQAPPTPPVATSDAHLLAWAAGKAREENKLASSKGTPWTPLQCQKRQADLFAHAIKGRRLAAEKEREKQVRLEQVEIQCREAEEKQKQQAATAAAEQLRIQQDQDRERLAQLQRNQLQEKARQEEERKKAARVAAAAAAEKQRGERIKLAEFARKEREEAALLEAAAARERERKARRKEELSRDPNRNYHSFTESREFWPLAKGEVPNRYLMRLMANQRMPMNEEIDTAIAIKWAKKNWHCFKEYPRDISACIEFAKIDEAKAKAEEEKQKPGRPSWMG